MSPLDLVFGIVITVLTIGMLAFMAVASFWIAVAVIAGSFFTGWFPLIIIVSNPEYSIGFDQGFLGQWGMIALIEYLIVAVVVCLSLLTTPSDDDNEWAVFRLLSWFSLHPTKELGAQFYRNPIKILATKRHSLNQAASSAGDFFKMKQQAESMKQEATELKKQNDKRERELERAAAFAEAKAELEKQKAIRDAYDRFEQQSQDKGVE